MDIGCGNGFLGKILKIKGAQVYGCDISLTAILKAKECLDKAFVFNLETDDFTIFDNDYDLIIATELIEHLLFPNKFLINVKTILSDNGRVVITTPNFLVWSNRIKMLFGKFEYKKTGFFDESHIHFFSYTSLKKKLLQNNFVIDVENNIIHPKIPNWLGKLIPSLFVYQIVFKIRINNN